MSNKNKRITPLFFGDLKHSGTFYSSCQLAPILVKLSKNSNVPDYEVCKTALSPYYRGEVPRKVIENVRQSAKEMMGTGSTADSITLLPSLFEKLNNLGHYGEI